MQPLSAYALRPFKHKVRLSVYMCASVLVVDDDPVNLELMTYLLRALKCSCRAGSAAVI